MTRYMSVWTGKRAVFLGVALSLYTFTLMYVFPTVEHAHYSVLSSLTPRLHSSSFIDSNDSRRSLTMPPNYSIRSLTKPPNYSKRSFTKQLIVTVIPEDGPRYNVDTPIIPPMMSDDKQWGIQQVKQNVRPQEIQSAKLNVGQKETQSLKLNVEPLKFLAMKLNDTLPEIPQMSLKKVPLQIESVKLNVTHILRNSSVFFKKTKSSRDSTSYFRPRLYGPALELLLDTMAVFDVIMTRNGLEYMLYGGSLIGSYRHHGLVPWDDDMDVLIPRSTQPALYHALTSLSPQYVLNKDLWFSWKLFSAKSDEIRGYNWKWPFLDIFFYAENETHIWENAPKYRDKYVFPKSIVFPLRRRPFMGLRLLTPHNSRAVIATNYDLTLCQSGTWIHKSERCSVETSIHCSLLYFKFPFVFRTFQNGGCNESLVHNGTVIGHFFQDSTSCDT